jgi:hypothetical protein
VSRNYNTPAFEAEINIAKKALSQGYSDMFTVVSDLPRYGGQTVFVNQENQHTFVRALPQFNFSDDLLWNIPYIQCNSKDKYRITDSDYYIKVVGYQKTKTYTGVLLNNKIPCLDVYDVSFVGESKEEFVDRLYRKAEFFLTLSGKCNND